MKIIPQSLRAFFAREVAGGIFLCSAALIALIAANSPSLIHIYLLPSHLRI